jgi:O-antigen ligase-like membrane protein
MSTYLLVDAISGVLMAAGAQQALLSQAWKVLILLLIFAWALRSSPGLATILTVMIVWILAGPLLRLFLGGDSTRFLGDLSAAMKAATPLIVLGYCNQLQFREFSTLRTWLRRALWLGSAIMLVNIVLGLSGFGYATYDYESATSGDIGVKGFFYAGNEVSATFVVLAAFVLMEVWNGRRGLYAPVALAVVVAAFTIGTKTAILSSVLLSFGLPLFYYRGNVLKVSLPGALAYFAALGLLAWGAIEVWLILQISGLAPKVEGVLAAQGLIGVIFSGRDQYAAATLSALLQYGTPIDVLAGLGREGLLLWSGREGAEIDPLDLYLWFGVPGVSIGMLIYLVMLYVAVRGFGDRDNRAAPAVLLTNLLLILISISSGHVVLAGMVGIAWAMLNATVFVSRMRRDSREPISKLPTWPGATNVAG